MAHTTLKRVMARRVQLLKKHPGWSNKTAMKEAWRLEKGHRVSGVSKTKRKPAARKKAVRKVHHTRKRTQARAVSGIKHSAGLGAVRDNANETRRILEGAIGEFMARQYFARTKTEKRKIGKKIADLKRQARHASQIIKKSHGKG